MVSLTTREKAHRSKLVKEYNDLLEKKKEAHAKLTAYEKILMERNHSD